ncbi:Uncharacterised protein [Vibrio cholerae]|nr:Uncharacterised protein [Vibrio cholerae]
MVALSDMMRPIFFPQSFNLIVVVQIKLTVFNGPVLRITRREILLLRHRPCTVATILRRVFFRVS